MCNFTLTNNGESAYSVLKWNTPLNDLALDGLTVSRDGEELSPQGIRMKREDPAASDFLTIVPGETVSSKFDLSSEYDTNWGMIKGFVQIKLLIDVCCIIFMN